MPKAPVKADKPKRAADLYRELEATSIYDPNYADLLKEAVLAALDVKRRE